MLLTDPGAYVYVGPKTEGSRALFRGTAAHNTLTVDGMDQAESSGPFPWRTLPQVTVDLWASNRRFDLLIASHDGYMRLPQPVRHRRCVFNLKSNFCVIQDLAEGTGNHTLDVAWHLAPGANFAPLPSPEAKNSESAPAKATGIFLPLCCDGLAIISASQQNWMAQTGEYSYSPVYGSRVQALKLVHRWEGKLPASLATILAPVTANALFALKFTRLASLQKDGCDACELRDGRDVHRLWIAGAPRTWQWKDLETDARLFYRGASAAGTEALILCGASFAKLSGKLLFQLDQPMSWLEATLHDLPRLDCSDPAISGSEEAVLAVLRELFAAV